ncbi:uncharacterized protein E0L32_006539 [Thyridium curvatum]|uniref:NADP-dependent oxidoreductase domain-containing protein n=1 Tax=Thyridium curvatum TaxID=1093900 RepID=A0A507AZN8_9PEZI|nr:uncharacterized protein E0L32_006539 [Thyridium curvatum]TPX13113.1 hypothetical protein E0L32_006539 [Thyridium curvatum]
MSSVLPLAPPPKGPLGRYRLLSPTASVRVSPLCLGAMNFGDAWKSYMGECDEQTTEKILDFFYEQGGNFIDTSNNYQFEESEQRIGAWMKKRGNRDEMVIATKYTTNYRSGKGNKQIMANFTGNGAKSLHMSVEASLKKLQTDYIDLLYVHWWDHSTSIPEVMQSLNQLVLAGKVLYLGISDTPAWVVSKANEYARNHGLRPFCVYQGRWSAASRDFERDIIPMARDEGMALAPWGALGGGAFKSDEQRAAASAKEGRQVQASDAQVQISRALEAVAKRRGTLITSVALAYVMHKAPYVFPIVGGRNPDHLRGNIEALTLELSPQDMDEIEGAAPFDVGFPQSFYYGGQKPSHPADVWLLRMAGHFDYVALPQPISPPKDDGNGQ